MAITLPRITLTTLRISARPLPLPAPDPAVQARPAHAVLASLRMALSACEGRDPSGLGSDTAVGGALVALARIGRETTAALGGEPGSPLSHAPGVVVLRELLDVSLVLAAVLGRPAVSVPGAAQLAALAARAENALAASRAEPLAAPPEPSRPDAEEVPPAARRAVRRARRLARRANAQAADERFERQRTEALRWRMGSF